MNETSLVNPTVASGLRAELRHGTKGYDSLAAIPLVAWYGLTAIGQFSVAWAQIGKIGPGAANLVPILTILSKVAVFLFASVMIGMLFARRAPSAGAQGILPRVVAILGTYLSVGLVLLPQNPLPIWVLIASTAMILGGMAFAIYALLFLGRSISMMPEARRLVCSGPYSLIRHPLYVGEEIAFFGAALQFFSVWTPIIVAAQVTCQFYRMHYEETVLSGQFPEYSDYKRRTFRLIPGLY